MPNTMKVWILRSGVIGDQSTRLFATREAGITELMELIEYAETNGIDSVKEELEGDGDVDWEDEEGEVSFSLYEQCTED